MTKRVCRIFALVLFLLGGCAGGGAWTRPGADAADTAAALRQCRTAADRAIATEEDIDEDIEAARATDWQRSSIGGLAGAQLGAETQTRADRIIASCMRASGFVPAR